MKRSLTVIIIPILAMTMLLSGALEKGGPALTFAQNSPGRKVYTLKWSSVTPLNYPPEKTAQWLVDEVNKRCKDRLKVEFYCSNAMGFGAAGQLDALSKNLSQMSNLCFSHFAGQQPEPDGLDLPRFVDADNWNIRPTLTVKTLPILQKIFDKHNIILLTFTWDAARQLACNKPVNGLADVRKMKVRAMAGTESDAFKWLGISGANVSAAEVYTALHQGVIDAAASPYLFIAANKWPEVALYIYNWSLNTSCQTVAINKVALSKLPKDMQQAIRDLQADLHIKMRDFHKEGNDTAKQLLAGMKCTFTNLSATDAAQIDSMLLPMWEEWYKRASPEGKALYAKAVETMKEAGYKRFVPK
jgi:TRAP-type C4-dicarboxylate transport system substrate-binding protein